jgi:hypothetical protein
MSKGIFISYIDIYNKQRPPTLREQPPLPWPLGAPLSSLTSPSCLELD